MAKTYLRWTHLGLSAALAGTAALAGCGSDSPETAEPPALEANTDTELSGMAGEGGEAGEAGEGEGGVSIAAAMNDPIVYGSALAITEAHIIAARDAFIAGETDAAAEMFAHPVSEVLADMAPIFGAREVEPFEMLLVDASGAILDGESETQIVARADAIIAALRAAANNAPENGVSEANIAAGIIADQVERASDMYRLALESERYEPYLDGYGFYRAALATYDRNVGTLAASKPRFAAAASDAFAALEVAYPTATRPDTLEADPAALTAAASNVVLRAGR